MKKTLLTTAIILLSAGAVVLQADNKVDKASYMTMVMRNKQEIKVEYDEQIIPWISTDIRNEINCDTIQHFEMDKVSMVFIMSEVWNHCADREEWEFMIFFTDGSDPLSGFMEIQAPLVSARCIDTGVKSEKEGVVRPTGEDSQSVMTSNFMDIDRIIFHRSER